MVKISRDLKWYTKNIFYLRRKMGSNGGREAQEHIRHEK